jgi:arylsulfotransferase ASST
MIDSRARWTAGLVLLAGCGISLWCLVGCEAPDDDGAPPRSAPGRWREINGGGSRAEVVDGVPDGLRGLPYLQGYEAAPDRTGVTIHDKQRAYPGLNFYSSGHGVEAGLMDMRGKVLHRWTNDAESRFRTTPRSKDPELRESLTHWRRACLLENGDILALYTSTLLLKLNRDSAVIWESDLAGPHHHMQMDENGLTYVLTSRLRPTPELDSRKDVIDDVISVLDAEGRVVSEHSLFEAFKNSSYAGVLSRLRPQGEIFHTNTLQVFDGSLSSASSRFRKGNVLVSMLYLNQIAIVNLTENRVVWALDGHETGLWHGMHEPVLLDNGNMLIFDNNWREAGVVSKSRVVEFNPFTQKVVWLYEGNEEHPFYSMTCGTCQRLPNGNTLITETDSGRAFEVMPDKEIVWEYISPERAGPENELIASLLHVERVEPEYVKWLSSRQEQKPVE